MHCRRMLMHAAVAVMLVVAFLVVLSLVGCASAPHGGKVQQQCQAAPGGAVACTCTGAP